ncbi:MAG: DUF6600 domain-containing protein [Burkholderiales bacterium]|nr:DUF6600 domain-containing protein [Burkholderiales bacterium]
MHPLRLSMKQFVAALLTGAMASLALAADPPGRVGRVTMIEGTVKFYADQENGWEPARLNLPVTSENSIWAEGRSRAEWRVGPAAIRLDHDTVLDVQKLEDTETLLYLQRGAANIRVGLIEKGEVFRIFTPEGTMTLRARGSYRIEADMDKGESRIAVLSGRARVESTAGSPWIEAGRMALLERGSTRIEPLARTEFDDWAQTRDDGLDIAAPEEVSPYMTGYEELNRHGNWEEEGEYGRVWVPRVVVDWAPYRYGHWRYVRPWGWTWIDDAPWGFAPMHYGRWVHVRGRWAWWPGNRIHRPVWSPALVAWVGGSGWSVTYSTGSGPGIGWFPLAPYEAYVPWYRHSPTYVYNINHIHRNRPVPTRPPRQYANHKPGVTVVSPTTFQAALPVATHRGRIPGEAIWNQPVVQDGGNLPPRRSNAGTGNPAAPFGKPALLQPTSPAEPQPLPLPLPQRAEEPIGNPRAQKPVPTVGVQPGGPKPGTMGGNSTVPPAESMPSRPAPQPMPFNPPAAQSPSTPSSPSGQQGWSTPAPVIRGSEPQPRYSPKPRSPVESTQTLPQPAPVTREMSPVNPRPAQRIDSPERVQRIERPHSVDRPESAPSRPAPSVQPSAPPVQVAPPPKPAPRELKERDEPPQAERIKNPGRVQER